jgi:hypothetical protein
MLADYHKLHWLDCEIGQCVDDDDSWAGLEETAESYWASITYTTTVAKRYCADGAEWVFEKGHFYTEAGPVKSDIWTRVV